MSFFDLPDPQFQLTPEAQMPPPQFRAGNGQPQITAGTGGRNPYMDFLRRNRPQTGATLPAVYNGGQQAAGPGDDNPVRSDVVTALGGRGGQMPSLQQFLASMPQSQSVSFGSGHGQIANGLGIGGPPTQNYTPATQGPTQASDHTNAGIAAFGNILGQYTTGPESPTQALARVNASLAHSLEAQARFGPQGLARREADRLDQTAAWERSPHRMAAEYARGGLAAGLGRNQISSDVSYLGGLFPPQQGAMQPRFDMATGATPQGGVGGVATPPGATTPTGTPPPNPNEDALSELFGDVARRHYGSANQATPGQRIAAPPTMANASQPIMNAALTDFVNSPAAQRMLQTPEGINALREFIVRPTSFGQGPFDRFFTARPTAVSLFNWRPTEEQQAHQRAIDTLVRSRNAVAGPNDQIGFNATRNLGNVPLWRIPGGAIP